MSITKSTKKVIKEALKVLGKKNFALISHANSFPSYPETDTGFGNSNSRRAKDVIDFASGVFNCIQLGPAGKTKSVDASPYTGTIFSNNPLFIDLEELTTKKWNKILSEETFKSIVENNPSKNTNRTAYGYIFEEQNKALKEAFSNFKPNKEFEKFKKENSFWLEKDSLYEVLSLEHGNDYWPLWKSDLDKNLFNTANEEQQSQANVRIKELKEKYEKEIEFYAFCQYVISVQSEETKKYALKQDIKMIADRQVAFSDRDIWAYQSLFLDGWYLGCPPDYFSKDGQAWGFPVVNPEKMYKEDGSLGEAGQLMKALYLKMFKENPGGVRIDHLVGLIDPWVYKKGNKPKVEEGAGRLYSSPHHDELKKYAIATMDDLNWEVEPDKEKWIKKLTDEQIKQYALLLEKVVIAAAKEVGLSKDAIVCEDLGTLTYPVEQVIKYLGLQGMRLTQFVVPEKPAHPYRMCNIEEKVWAMVGTHDNEPIAMWADKSVNTHEGWLHAKNLAEDLNPDKDEKAKEMIAVELSKNAQFLTQTKLVELFASKAENIQVFFTDLFGMYEVYNRPGTSGSQNWSLRMPNNFEEYYCQQLRNQKGLNLPLILKLAIEARGEAFAKKNEKMIKELNKVIEEDLCTIKD